MLMMMIIYAHACACCWEADLSRMYFERYIHCPKIAPPEKTNLTLAMIEESEYHDKDKASMRRWYGAQLEKDQNPPPPPSKAPPIPSLGNARSRQERADYHGDDRDGEARGGFYHKALSRSNRAPAKGMR